MSKTPIALMVKLDWVDWPDHANAPKQVAAIKNAIECICGVEEVRELFDAVQPADDEGE